MLKKLSTITETRNQFRWQIPPQYNIGHDICDRWAETEPDRLAIIDVGPDGTPSRHSFKALRDASNRLANLITTKGFRDSRIAVLLPQSFETAVAHIGILKTGNVSLPLFTLFGPEALAHRLRDSGTRMIITNAESARVIAGLRARLPDLELVLSVDGDGDDADCFHTACAAHATEFRVQSTAADDPAILIYTSGTTGNPKGALHAHRTLLGHLPGVEMSHDFFPQPGDLIWTPADWAWIGGLLDVLMPALHHGVPVVAHRFAKFSAEAAFELIRRFNIRNAFLPPTALKLMRQLPQPRDDGIRMRSVASGGETLGAELIVWGQATFGVTINEFYGQTECNMIVSACAALEPAEPGTMGFAVPGHEVAVINPETGERLPPDTEGEIAVLTPDPVMFIGYFNQPEATAAKFIDGPDGKWLKTGDRGRQLASGKFRFIGRDDDVINSSGYRIGPSEIEDCLLTHPAVQMAGVVGKPDPVRGEIVIAYIVLNTGFDAHGDLADAIAAHVKANLAAYEYPREVHFLDTMPLTTTGKIIRRELRAMATAS